MHPAQRIEPYLDASLGEVLQAAQSGEAAAQAELGARYRDGRGVDKDVFKSLKWLKLAAEQHYPRAQRNLGGLFDVDGLKGDPADVLEWYQKAADQGDPEAQFNLGSMYQNGEGVVTDPAEERAVIAEAQLLCLLLELSFVGSGTSDEEADFADPFDDRWQRLER